ncbi:MAG TPA: aspartate--tRNA ligase [Candidatus Omnitrophica bacterium]|mgnify:FL=1|nr:MAG: aspartate--tRNA ligase [Candidatus Omnitrophota bacterium]HEC69692.1 aspartate--tRNA ligase [Candidatus Omnitrophota bacterium]
MLRTHTCGELTKKDLDKEVILCGWVSSRRDHGKIIFIDLRDRYGLTQVVFIRSCSPNSYERAEKLRNEDVIKVKGKVSVRPEGTENPKISTGEIEVLAEELEILNSSEELPFLIEDNIEASEEIRLLFRFLDLRRKPLLKNLELRHKVIQSMRTYLNNLNFLEVETPFLTKSTPEGARDFLVPSRLNPSCFYALPQSPQLFKQVLMVSGLDRYYQIVRCFRDEDLRKDRQPEFTQLDLEMSFVEEEDIYEIIEGLCFYLFKEVLGIELKIPFPRLTYKEAYQRYSSDKPDLSTDEPFRFVWVTGFPLFKYNQEEARWDSEHHPFTAPFSEDLALLDKDPSQVRARSYDLVLNGQEIGSGSIRIHNPSLQKKIFAILNISEQAMEEKFGFLIKALNYGAPPHGGFALGLDRFLAIITDSASIREVIAFPKTQKGVCPLTGAPAKVSLRQLRELNIKVIRS